MKLRTLIRALAYGLILGFALDPIFAASTTSNLWNFRTHVEPGGAITMTAEVLDMTNLQPNVQLPSYKDLQHEDPSIPAHLKFRTGTNVPVGTKFTAGYYRGPFYTVDDAGMLFAEAGSSTTNYVSIFTTGDRTQIIAAVDHGLVYTSTNSGMAWTIITTPGLHMLPICTAADGGGYYAYVTIDQPSPLAGSALTNRCVAQWYAVTSSADGSKLVVGSSSSQPAPFLSIRYAENGVTIVWPAQFSAFVLEHTSDFGAGIWTDVTSAVDLVGAENHVVVPPAIGHDFFRLRKR